ncbi:MAG: hypothetical protein AAFN30_11125 [Actinomycetota bacterium]
MRARLSVLLLVGGVVFVAACGSEEAGEATAVGATATEAETSTTDVDVDDDEQTGTTAEPSGSEGDGSTTSESGGGQQGGELAGDPFDIGPGQGDRLDVVGVAHDDELNFRVLPDAGSTIVDAVAPQATSPVVISQGEGRLLTRSAWWHVTVGGQDAWANFSFLGMLGGTDDVFDELSAQLGVIEEANLDDLVAAIASVRGSDGPEPRVTYVTDPDAGSGRREVVVDIIGYGDDALKGERFTLTVTDAGDAGDGVRLIAAEATLICGRGVSGEACV